MNNDQNTTAGFRVIDAEGGTHEYPNAYDAFANRGDLILTDEKSVTIAIFHRWESVERIA